MQFTGKLIQNGKVILDPVKGEYEGLTSPGRIKNVIGSLSPPLPGSVRAGGNYELVLAGGQSFKIVIIHRPFLSDGHVTFGLTAK